MILEEWRKQLKTKPLRYWSRIEIEEIIKEKESLSSWFFGNDEWRQVRGLELIGGH